MTSEAGERAAGTTGSPISLHEAVAMGLGGGAQGKLANWFRDAYFNSGHPSDLHNAYNHYEAAIKKSADNPFLLSMLLCDRLTLYIHELSQGNLKTRMIEAKLLDALDAIRQIRMGTEVRFKRRTIKWLKGYLEELRAPIESAESQTVATLGQTAIRPQLEAQLAAGVEPICPAPQFV